MAGAPVAWDLGADFFAAQIFQPTYGTDQFPPVIEIRIQHGGDLVEFADGVVLRVDDYPTVGAMLGTPVAVGPGQTVEATFYLSRTCRDHHPMLVGASGTVTFTSMYAGPDSRIIGSFQIHFDDPTYPGNSADLTGDFNFVYRRGRPAEPFS